MVAPSHLREWGWDTGWSSHGGQTCQASHVLWSFAYLAFSSECLLHAAQCCATGSVQCHEMDRTGEFFQNPDCLWWGDGAVGPPPSLVEDYSCGAREWLRNWRGVQGWGEVITVTFQLSVANFSAGYSLLKRSMVKQVWVHIWTRITNHCSVSKLWFFTIVLLNLPLLKSSPELCTKVWRLFLTSVHLPFSPLLYLWVPRACLVISQNFTIVDSQSFARQPVWQWQLMPLGFR